MSQKVENWVALVAVVTVMQIVLSLLQRVLPLFAVPLTMSAGVQAESVGQLIAVSNLGTAIFFLWGTLMLAPLPAFRQLQLGGLLAGAGILLCLEGSWFLMLLSALVIGIGNGPTTPAGSDLMMRIVPQSRRSLAFSIKQAGVPLGGLAAGLFLPGLALYIGFNPMLVVCFVLTMIVSFMLPLMPQVAEPARSIAKPNFREIARAPMRMLALVLSSKRLRRISFAALGLGFAQSILMGYLPAFLNDNLGYSLTSVGLIFALSQGVGALSRVVMGWLCDWIGSQLTLRYLAIASAVTLLLTSLTGPETPVVIVTGLSMLAGLTVMSWNGVFLSALAVEAPVGRVGEITSGGTFLLFCCLVISPIIMQGIVQFTGSYNIGIAFAAIGPVFAALVLLYRDDVAAT